MTDHSFEHKIKQSLESFEDQVPPTLAEWNAVSAAIEGRRSRSFGFYFWRVIAALGALSLLLFGWNLYENNQYLNSELMDVRQCLEEATNSGTQNIESKLDTLVIVQKSIDTVYVIQKSFAAQNLGLAAVANQKSQSQLNENSTSRSSKLLEKQDKITERSSISENGNNLVAEVAKPKIESTSNSINHSKTSQGANSNQEFAQVSEDKKEEAEADKKEEREKKQEKEVDSKELADLKDETEAEEIQPDRKKLEYSTYVALSGALAKPYGRDIKETNLARLSGEMEWKFANRIGIATGFQYAFLKYEHQLNGDILSQFPDVDMSYYDLYTTINALNVPLRLKLYVLPDKTLTPYVSVGLTNQIWHQSKYRFTDSPLYNDANRYKNGLQIQPQFALIGVGISIFNRGNIGSDIELQYNYGLSKSGIADPGLNAFGAKLRVFYQLR